MVIKIYVFELKKKESFFNVVVIIRYDGIMILKVHGNNDIDLFDWEKYYKLSPALLVADAESLLVGEEHEQVHQVTLQHSRTKVVLHLSQR